MCILLLIFIFLLLCQLYECKETINLKIESRAAILFSILNIICIFILKYISNYLLGCNPCLGFWTFWGIKFS